MKIVRMMIEMAEVGPDDIVYDLGSGDGRIVLEAARRRQARAVGIEADPLRVLWSWLVIRCSIFATAPELYGATSFTRASAKPQL